MFLFFNQSKLVYLLIYFFYLIKKYIYFFFFFFLLLYLVIFLFDFFCLPPTVIGLLGRVSTCEVRSVNVLHGAGQAR